MASRLDDLIRDHAERLDQLAGPIALADVTCGPRGDNVTVTLIDTEPTPTQPEGRRRWPIIAVAAALVAIAVGGLMLTVGDEDPTSKVPADQPSTNAPTPVAPVGRVGFVGLPPEGAPPSTPVRGEAVLAISSCQPSGEPTEFVGWNGELTVYADGRLICRRYTDLPEGANQMFTGYLEQRLTDVGVELMRSEVVASGLLRPGEQDCEAGEYSVYVFEEPGSSLTTRASELVARLTDPASWLPADAWQDREIRAFVPSQYVVNVTLTGQGRLQDLAAQLPAETSQLLLAKEWGIQSAGGQTWYVTAYTSVEARALAAALNDANLEQDEFMNAYLLQYNLPDASVDIKFHPVLPHDIGMGPRPGTNIPAPAAAHLDYCWDHFDRLSCP